MKRLILVFCFLISACEDESAAIPPLVSTADMEQDPNQGDMGTAQSDAGTTADADVPPVPETAYVELALSPRRAIYGFDEHPEVIVVAYDRTGEEIPDAEVYLDIQPEGIAEIDDDRQLTFLMEGQGAVRGCARPGLCGRASFFVDRGPPSLEVIEPARGAYLSGDPSITVVGRTDAEPGVRVFVNDEPVAVDDEGQFTHMLRAEFGLNRIDVVADDGVRRPAPRTVREVMWAPNYLVPGREGVGFVDSVVMRIGQNLLDADQPLAEPEPDGALLLDDVAGFLETVINRAELMNLLPDNAVENSDTLSLQVNDITTGLADVTVLLVDGGIEVFVRFDGMQVETGGEFRLADDRYDLTGMVTVGVAGYVRANLINGPEQVPVLQPAAVDIAIENLDGEMEDSTVQALIDTIGSALQGALQRFTTSLITELLEERVPDVIELGLADVLEPLRSNRVSLDADGFLPAMDLGVGVVLNRLEIEPRAALGMYLNTFLAMPEPVDAPHPTEGIPTFGEDLQPIWPAQSDLSMAFRLLNFNAVLDSLWRQGLLGLDLTAVVPEQLAILTGARLDGHLPPVIVPAAPGSSSPMEFQLGEALLEVDSMFNPDPDVYSLSIRVGVSFEIDRNGARLQMDESPDIRFELVQAGGDAAFLPSEVFEDLFNRTLWPELSDSFAGVLDISMPPIVLQLDELTEFAPSIDGLTVEPSFNEEAVVRNGWVVLSADARLRVE